MKLGFLLCTVLLFGCSRKHPEAVYVDAKRCQPCHAQIYATYSQTGMARSFSRPSAITAPNGTVDHAASNLVFESLTRVGRVFQGGSEPGGAHRFEREAHYVIGSGNHARTFLHRLPDGEISELPITWYAAERGWAMSPGFDTPDHQGFRRRIDHGCMFCHNSYPAVPAGTDRYGVQAVFPSELPMGIDCQRCHGPGSMHVERPTRETIVNPARLDPQRQLDVCMQCHLETTSAALPASTRRFGRNVYSFRPGEALGDYMVYFDHVGRDDKFEINGAAYRLRRSRCFLASGGRMTCTTCHDPHQVTGDVSKRCQTCHAAAHHAEQNCATCHMPKRRTDDAVHVIMTDHKIQGLKPPGDLLAPRPEKHEEYTGRVVLYYPSDVRDRDVYLGMANGEKTSSSHPKALVMFADALMKRGDKAGAADLYSRALRADAGLEKARINLSQTLPESEAITELQRVSSAEALLALGLRTRSADALQKALQLSDDLAEAHAALGQILPSLDHLRAAVAIDPRLPEPRLNLGRLLYQMGRQDEALVEFRVVVARHPNFAEGRLSLGVALGEKGDLRGAVREFREVLRIDPANQDAARNLKIALQP
jgi:Flp pilus assembly protein TadD